MHKESGTIEVGLGDRSYPIIFGQNLLSDLGNQLTKIGFPKKVAIVTNLLVYNFYGKVVVASLENAGFDTTVITLPDGEEFKNSTIL